MALTPNERKAELVRRGITTRSIAVKLRVVRPYISMVLHGKRRSDRIERAIARAIGRPVAEVFEPRDLAA